MSELQVTRQEVKDDSKALASATGRWRSHLVRWGDCERRGMGRRVEILSLVLDKLNL
jgi:hypothetical protein